MNDIIELSVDCHQKNSPVKKQKILFHFLLKYNEKKYNLMTKNSNNFVGFHDIIDNPSLLDYEEDSEFLEWYSMEGSKRISELSRQLHSFLNYKSAIIRFRFSGSREGDNALKKDPIMKREGELFSLSSRYATLLKMIGVEGRTVTEKILILMERVKAQPNDFEINLLKEIKQLVDEIWKIFHILSESEIHHHPRLLQVAIKIASISCSVESAYFWPFSRFYEELKKNYLQLEEELSGLLRLNGEKHFEARKKKRRVRIIE